MQPAITTITLAVDDLDRALRFYRDGLGLATTGIVGTTYPLGACAFFDLAGGLKLALWPRSSLAADTGLPVGPRSATEVLISHNVASHGEVQAVLDAARAAGARVVKEAQPMFWGGFGGYFQDPDGHLWEVVFNPRRSSGAAEPRPTAGS